MASKEKIHELLETICSRKHVAPGNMRKVFEASTTAFNKTFEDSVKKYIDKDL